MNKYALGNLFIVLNYTFFPHLFICSCWDSSLKLEQNIEELLFSMFNIELLKDFRHRKAQIQAAEFVENYETFTIRLVIWVAL